MAEQTSTTESLPLKLPSTVRNGTSGVITTVLNMAKLMIGSGMLSLPWAFSHSGVIPAFIVAVFCATFDFIGAMLLVISSEHSQLFEYSSLLRSISPFWEKTGSLCLLYVVSGSLIGYIILIGDFVHSVLLQFGVILFTRQHVILIFMFFVLIPLTLLKNLSSLRYSSIVGMAAILYTLIFLLQQTFHHIHSPGFQFGNASSSASSTSQFTLMSWNLGIFIVTNVFTQAYVCHYSVQRIYLDMRDRTLKKAFLAIGSSYIIVLVLYCAFALCGYILYGSESPSDILNAFEQGIGDNKSLKIAVVVARLGMTCSVIGTYPLAFVSCQANLENNFFNRERNRVWNYVAKPHLRKVVILATNGVYLLLGCVIPTIGPVVSINGAISTIGLVCVFPIAQYWNTVLVRKNKRERAEVEEEGGLQAQMVQPLYQSVQNKSEAGEDDRGDDGKESGDRERAEEPRCVCVQKVLLSFMAMIGVTFGIAGLVATFTEVTKAK